MGLEAVGEDGVWWGGVRRGEAGGTSLWKKGPSGRGGGGAGSVSPLATRWQDGGTVGWA